MVDRETLDRLRAIDPYTVISRFIDLKKSGGNWMGRCPFHDDRSPSFAVFAGDRPGFHCFGCGAHGDVIDFLQRQQGLSFNDAVAELAAEAGITVTSEKRPAQPLKGKARFTPAQPAKEGHQGIDLEALARWQARLPEAKDYLDGRRIPLEVAQAVGAGFLPKGEAMGLNAEGRPTGWGPRIVFPHSLPDGRVVNLYGRSTDPSAEKGLKHRHLPQPKGLLNPAALELEGELWIVEGAFDLLALKAAGIEKVVAVFGLDGFDWRWLGRQALVVATDHDDAGKVAAQKLLQEAAYRGLQARRLPAEAFGGEKDAAAAWAAGKLDLSGWGPAGDAVTNSSRDIAHLVETIGDAPEPHLARGWPQFKALAARFSTLHLQDALAAGWEVADIYSLPWNLLGSGGGAVWALSDAQVEGIEVRPDCIVANLPGGGRLTYRRDQVTGHLPWIKT